ncbi:MAG: NADH-quinone oxidoreductase subunit NuoH [Planctomycetota bacterium]|jgi:NADH-quinone oxidoreductase subunit H
MIGWTETMGLGAKVLGGTLAAGQDIVSLVNDLVNKVSPIAVPAEVAMLIGMVAAAGAMVAFISVFGIVAVWLERKISARIQCRLGPMDVGPFMLGGRVVAGGLLQTLADGIKLIGKEDIIPAKADKLLFTLGPIIVFLGVFGIFAVIPFGPSLAPSDLDVGLVYVAAIGSLEAIGVIMAGWASNNKWSLFGTMRAATQVVSYEIPLGLAFTTIIVTAGSLSLIEVSDLQRGWITNWFMFANPFCFIAFIIYNIAALAEAKRAPFDLPEAESELVYGFHTEYSGMRFSIFFIAEYAAMYMAGALAAVLFMGGYYTGIAPIDQIIYERGVVGNLLGMGAILTKGFFIVFVQMWIRWTLPRVRLDQIMHLCLKVLLPFSLACVMGTATWILLFGETALLFLPRGLGW